MNMKSKALAISLCALAAACASTVSAQAIRPGLWQLYSSTPGKSGGVDPMVDYVKRMKKEMATMAPEDRAAMEEMLAELAASKTEYTKEGFRTTECISRDQANKIGRLFYKDSGTCSETLSPIEIGRMTIDIKCTRPVSTTSATVNFQGDKGYNFKSKSIIKDAQGKPITYEYEGWGKWLGSDCGKVRAAPAEE
jgi:hypothetical protein